ncbi:hypothetical protein OY671_011233, partial [Metschnikowia pulcherrima]
RSGDRGGLLRFDGRCQQVREGRCHCGPADPGGQHHRGLSSGHDQPRADRRRCRAEIRDAGGWRRAGGASPLAAALHCRRRDRDPCVGYPRPCRTDRRPARRSAHSAAGCGDPGRDRHDTGDAAVHLPAGCRTCGSAVVGAEEARRTPRARSGRGGNPGRSLAHHA